MTTINLILPETWKRSVARRIGNTGVVVVGALNPYNLAVGIELLNGYGKGLGVMVGPLWLGVAFARFENSSDAS